MLLKNTIFMFVVLFTSTISYPKVQSLGGMYLATFGIETNNVDIVPGEIITEISVTLKGVNRTFGDPNRIMHVNFIDDPLPKLIIATNEPPLPYVEPKLDPNTFYISRMTRNKKAEEYGTPIAQYVDRKNGKEDYKILLSSVNNDESFIWTVYSKPLIFLLADGSKVNYSSSILEVMNYVGNGRGFGILLVPENKSTFSVDQIIIEFEVKSYQGNPITKILRFVSNSRPFLI